MRRFVLLLPETEDKHGRVSSSTDAQSNRVGVLQYLERPVLLLCDINTLCFKALIILCFFSVSEPRNIWQIFNLTSRLKRSCSCKWVKSSCRRIPEGLQYHVYKYKATPYEVVCLKGGRWQVWIPLTLEFGLKRREIKIRWDWRRRSTSTGIVVLVIEYWCYSINTVVLVFVRMLAPSAGVCLLFL